MAELKDKLVTLEDLQAAYSAIDNSGGGSVIGMMTVRNSTVFPASGYLSTTAATATSFNTTISQLGYGVTFDGAGTFTIVPGYHIVGAKIETVVPVAPKDSAATYVSYLKIYKNGSNISDLPQSYLQMSAGARNTHFANWYIPVTDGDTLSIMAWAASASSNIPAGGIVTITVYKEPNDNGKLGADYPIGSIITTGYVPRDTAPSDACSSFGGDVFVKSPAELGYAGVWEFKDKDFIPMKSANEPDYITPSSTNLSSTDLVIIRQGKTIEISGTVTYKVAPSDDDRNIGTFIPSGLGITGFAHNRRCTLEADSLNAVVMSRINTSNNVWYTTDYITRATSIPTTTSYTLSVNNVMLNIPLTHMLDSACNKFYWERIA